MARYISVVETAKMIRTALREAFPGVRFSVRSSSYSMGASINISYTDGPTNAQVRAITGNFEGSYFDGMTDYKGLNYSSLNGEEVRFGADFIFVERNYSQEFLTTNLEAACAYYGYEMPEIIVGTRSCYANFNDYDMQRRVMLQVEAVSLCETQISQTAGSVAFLGDDGYGYGAVGRLAA
jgi:hypothetical protein